MRFVFLLQIIQLLALLNFAQACDSSFNTIGCNFYVGNQSADCTSFILNQCTWQVCEFYVRIGNSTTCGSYKTVSSSDWGSCMSHCCGDLNGPQTYDTLQSCYNSNQSKLIIIFSVIGGVTFIVIVAAICYKYREKILNCCKCFKPREEESVAAPDYPKEPIECKTIEILKKREIWNDCILDEANILADMNCAICLTVNPSVKLQCGHYYHRICILEWVGKRAVCPLCQSAQINEITILCERCLAKQRTGNLQLSESLTTNPEFCENCKC